MFFIVNLSDYEKLFLHIRNQVYYSITAKYPYD